MTRRLNSNEFIFRNTDKVIDTTSLDEFYTMIGNQDYLDDNNNPRVKIDNEKTLAKKLFTDQNKPRYLVKINTDGKFHDPFNIHSKPKVQSNFLDKTCKEPKFKAVTGKVFDMYVKFLQTKNLSWLYNANREAE